MIKKAFMKIKKAVCLTVVAGVISVSTLGGAVSTDKSMGNMSVVKAEGAGLSDYISTVETRTDSQKPEGNMDGYPVSENRLKPVEINDGKADSALSRRKAAVFDAKYDPRNVNGEVKVSAVRDQGDYNTCWAFSLIAAMESNLILKGYADASIDLSENQFAYFFYNRQTDKLGYTKGDKNNYSVATLYKYGDYAWAQNGGTLQGSGLALTTWAGVTSEGVSPYVSIPAKELCYQQEYSIKNILFYDYSIQNLSASVSNIKQAITEHGAVAAGLYAAEQYFREDTGAYYCTEKEGNHAVAIVGWDDAYSRNNFGGVKPSKDGAWIVKNSYGTEGKGTGDHGYWYVSYEDASLTEFVAVDAVPASIQYNNNYQHDGTANPSCLRLPSGAKYANVFQAKASSSYCEELKAVGVCAYTSNVSYEVEIYTGLSSKSKPTSGTKAVSKVSGVLTNAGYQTIELPNPVALVPGEYFSVVVTLKCAALTPQMGIDMSTTVDWISFYSEAAKNQSFVYYKNKWLDIYQEAKAVARIKAYTNTTAIQPSIKLSDSSLGVSKGSSEKLALRKNPVNISRSVKWTSSNEKVATVSSSGKVKGKSYGNATISATFVKGGKKSTLKCKVTVGPSKIKSFNVSANGGKVTVKWKKDSAAKGYEVYYSAQKDSGYKKLATAKADKSKVTKKLNSGTYYVKMRAYRLNGKKKLYGSYTAAKQVTVQ